MNCKEAGEKTQELLDGELSGPQRGDLLRHFEKCESCGAAARVLGALAMELKAAPAQGPGPGFKAALMAKIAAEEPEPARLSDLIVSSALLLAPAAVPCVFQLVLASGGGLAASLRAEEFFSQVLRSPALDVLKASAAWSGGLSDPHGQLTVFAAAFVLLILVCQVKPGGHSPRRTL